MYFWKYKELSLALRDNTITAKQYRIYLIIFAIQVLLALPGMVMQPLWIAFTVLWLGITYTINRNGDGKDYFKRLVCLDLPVTIQTLVFAIILSLVMGLLTALVLHQGATGSRPIILFVTAAYLLYSLVLAAIGFKIAAGKRVKHG